jgi:muconolactone delta-isomerase
MVGSGISDRLAAPSFEDELPAMRFIVESTFAVAPTPAILALLPNETARGLELDAEGMRHHLFLAADQSAAWQIYETASRDELDRALASFPLHPYMTSKVTQLADPA